jgi:hypothetical protein
MRFCPSSKGHRIVLVLNGTSCEDIDDSVNDDVIVVHLTMIEAIYAVLEEWNRGNNDTMLNLDLDVDLIVRAIKDAVTRSTKQSSDIDRLVLDHRDGVRRC